MSIYEREKFLEMFQKAKETKRGFDIELALAYPADALSDAAEYVAAGRTSREDAALVRQAAQDLVVFAEWLAREVELQSGASFTAGEVSNDRIQEGETVSACQESGTKTQGFSQKSWLSAMFAFFKEWRK